MNKKIYIDGQHGTTGLQIHQRLKERDDIDLIEIPTEKRHDLNERIKRFEQADLIFLCLPDEASREAMNYIPKGKKVIDTSTAFRTSWPYGFSELSDELKKEIQTADHVANPGCHASAAISLLYPLSKKGLLSQSHPLSIFSLTGYSGGGKKMIAEFEENCQDLSLKAPQAYALSLDHKHLPEIETLCHLRETPVFLPVVDDFYNGLACYIPLTDQDLNREMSREELLDFFEEYYKEADLIEINRALPARLAANRKADSDLMELFVLGEYPRLMLVSVIDNLGKGACGAAIENMNLMLGLNPSAGLRK